MCVRVMRALAVLLLLLGFACDEAEVVEERPPPDHGEVPSDPLGARLHALGLERVRRLAPEGMIRRGTLRAGEVEEHTHVLLGTHCYSMIAVGSEGVEELDLVLRDPAGAPVMHDTDDGDVATLGITTSVCPMEPGMYSIRVRMFRGEGDYAMKVWSHQII